jgi:ATP-dependent RNA helicase DDX27
MDDVEFLVLDEADRLLDLGFQDEVHEIVKSCPAERQTMLFSATMSTKVDELIRLSLKRPVRISATDKDRTGRSAGSNNGVEVAPRLEQEFVRVRAGNEGVNREGMLLALLTRTFTDRVIVFFDTKAAAHRLMIVCGLCGIKCAELHGNLTQVQRLEALEAFREGSVDVLLCTDLAARGLDIIGSVARPGPEGGASLAL